MRLAPRFTAAIAVLVLTVAGCGGANVAYREVPGGPVELEVPGDGAAVGAATPTPTADADATETPGRRTPRRTPRAEPQATAAPDTGTDDGTGGGTEAPPADDATNDTPPPAGSPQQQFEDYCAENPGAC